MLMIRFKGVSRKFKGCFKEVSNVCQGSFREISRVLQESSKGVQIRMKGISSSMALYDSELQIMIVYDCMTLSYSV